MFVSPGRSFAPKELNLGSIWRPLNMTWCLASYRGIVYYLHQGQPYQLYEGKEGELKAGSFREPTKNLMVALKASSSHKEVFIWRTALF